MSDYTNLRRCDAHADPINDPVFAANVPYAMAYVRVQRWEQPKNAMDALRSGTAFSSLVMPFRVKEAQR